MCCLLGGSEVRRQSYPELEVGSESDDLVTNLADFAYNPACIYHGPSSTPMKRVRHAQCVLG